MRELQHSQPLLPEGCALTLGELRDMAGRQQQQIEAQQQLLVAREQRLKFLKRQEGRAAAATQEAERLRRLKERVDAQETKLRRLRALRGQVDNTRLSTASLTTDLDAMRHLFSEKEKELVLAVSKVDQLTRQLEDIRAGRALPNNQSNHQNKHSNNQHHELDKLRRELLYRNSVNREASQRVSSQREALAARKDEVARIDNRIAELQRRLQKKRVLNQQLATQITAATQAKQAQLKAIQQKTVRESVDAPDRSHNVEKEDLAEFLGGKHDPKYQTLPYNTKFSGGTRTHSLDSPPTPPPSSDCPPGVLSEVGDIANMNRNEHLNKDGSIGHMQPRVDNNRIQDSNGIDSNKMLVNSSNTNGPMNINTTMSSALPPTSLSESFFKKTNSGQNTNRPRPVAFSKDLDNVRAMPNTVPVSLSSNENDLKENEASSPIKPRPALPPKPLQVPGKPRPPPRQKGDPITNVQDNVHNSILQNSNNISNNQSRPQVYRYASQDVIMSTYTQYDNQQQTNGSQHINNNNCDIISEAASPKSSPMEEESSDLTSELIREQEDYSDLESHTTNSTVPVGELEKLTLEQNGESSYMHNEQINNSSNGNTTEHKDNHNEVTEPMPVVHRHKKGNLKTSSSCRKPRRVSFDPLALLLDASLEGELELVRRTAGEVADPSAANDEGITALHNAICAGHLDIVTFLVTFGCDVNAQDSDGWTPLHCAASCNNVSMVRFLVEHGACILATTLSDHETAAEKCEQDEEGYDGCSQYLYGIQEKLGIMNGGRVYAVYDYSGQREDELTFECGSTLTVLRRGDQHEKEWWWARLAHQEGYVPRNLLGLYPRVKAPIPRDNS